MISYQSALDYLYRHTNLEIDRFRFKVEVTDRSLREFSTYLKRLRDPQNNYPKIHVAGTNGKGSVVAMLQSILSQAGYKTGAFTSPHLFDVRERFTIDGIPISIDQFCSITEMLMAGSEQVGQLTDYRTVFTLMTALAFEHFRRSEVDIAIIEVGLGGRLDSTNVIQPILSIITEIGLDHTEILGDRIEEIAGEKAGIIKPNAPVIINRQPKTVLDQVYSRCQETNSPILFPDERLKINEHRQLLDSQLISISDRQSGQTFAFRLSLAGNRQLGNALLAIRACLYLQDKGWSITEDSVINGMEHVHWLGRLQCTKLNDGNANNILIIDGAHNRSAAAALREHIEAFKDDKNVRYYLAFSREKKILPFMEALAANMDDSAFIVMKNPRAKPREAYISELGSNARFEQLSQILERIKQNKEPGLHIFAGSLYFAGEVIIELAKRGWIEDPNIDSILPDIASRRESSSSPLQQSGI